MPEILDFARFCHFGGILKRDYIGVETTAIVFVCVQIVFPAPAGILFYNRHLVFITGIPKCRRHFARQPAF
jgi:hypothetical protein